MTDIDTFTAVPMDLGISVEEQTKGATFFEVSLGSSTDSTKSPALEVASLADEKSKDGEAACAEERSEECRAPGSRARRSYRFLRIVVFTVYRQLLTSICIINLIAILVIVASDSGLPPRTAATAAVANLVAAVLIRQDYIRNILFRTCWSIPHTAPLWLRRRLARIYENGGVHTGGAVCAIGWHIAFVSILTRDCTRGRNRDIALLLLCYALLAILVAIAILALPQIRDRHHNLFENAHRFGGWSCILIFWPILVLFVRSEAGSSVGVTLARALVHSAAFWLLLVISIHIIYPWILLRKVSVFKVEHLSDRAVRLYFSPKESIRPLHGVSISDSPLHEWHSFAAISDTDGTDGGAASGIVSKAGDWTARTVNRPADFYYMRGCHMTGTLYMAKVFRKVVIMATGSGVGPCLALFGHAPKTKIRFLWFASSPRSTFGEKIVSRVLEQDPQAVIWDTQREGQARPDVVTMAHALYTAMEAEAVFFISNKKLTKKVVRELKVLGVPAYAPVFDS
jgi:NAD(P)H-flavin reductase